ncbi:MAG: hypothetical protein AAGH15_17150 [Myxococcota bacterium]
MRRVAMALALAASGCFASLGTGEPPPEGDAAALMADGLAPRCDPQPSPPCFELAVRASIAPPPRSFLGIQGLTVTASGPTVFASSVESGGGSPQHTWTVFPFDRAARLGSTLDFFDESEAGRGYAPGGDIVTVDGRALVVFPRFFGDPLPGVGGWESVAAFPDEGATLLGPFHRVVGPEDDFLAPPIVRLAGDLALARTERGIEVRSLSRDAEGPTLAVDQREGFFEAAPLTADRALVVWSDRGTQAAVVSLEGVSARAQVFEDDGASGAPLAMLVTGEDLWVGRFQREEDALDQGRIRVARLDAGLARIGLDRWVNGWGGLRPSGIALVAFEGEPWLTWNALDVRRDDAAAVFFAQPLGGAPCGVVVGAPTFVPLPPDFGSEDLSFVSSRVAGDGSSLWVVATPGGRVPVPVLHRLDRCGS